MLLKKLKKQKEKNKRELYLWGHPIKEYIPIFEFYLIIGSIGIIISYVKDNIWARGACIFLLLSFFLYHYSNTTDIEHKDNEIASLRQKIRNLEEIKDSDKHIIEMLEKKLEKMQGDSQ
ncbi:MAG: hypothetical protein IJD36_01630 [Clostridia bacterium]|nr:hypothetical protein [Clostridia bacterium]